MLKYKNTLPFVETPKTLKSPAFSTYMSGTMSNSSSIHRVERNKKSPGELPTTAPKSTFVTEVKTLTSKPTSKDIQNRTAIPSKKEGQPKTASMANKRRKKEPEKAKHEFMDVLFGLVKQQVETYNTRFQTNNKEDIDRMLDDLENYPIYSLHRERCSQLQQFGVMYSKLLNMLINRRLELELRYKKLNEVLAKLRNINNIVPLTVTNLYPNHRTRKHSW